MYVRSRSEGTGTLLVCRFALVCSTHKDSSLSFFFGSHSLQYARTRSLGSKGRGKVHVLWKTKAREQSVRCRCGWRLEVGQESEHLFGTIASCMARPYLSLSLFSPSLALLPLFTTTPRPDSPQKNASPAFGNSTARTASSLTPHSNQPALIHLANNPLRISFIMAFASKGWYLKTDFLMSSILALLGLIVLGTMATKSYTPFINDQKICILAGDGITGLSNHASCVWSAIAGFLVAAGGVGLFAMDYVTWKRSEHFKGKRASVAALLISPTGAFISFATATIIGVGLKGFCKKYNSESHIDSCQGAVPELSSLYTGVTCATLAGFLFVFYGLSEYAQYRRRHIQGDKW